MGLFCSVWLACRRKPAECAQGQETYQLDIDDV